MRRGVRGVVAGLFLLSCLLHLWAQFLVSPFWIVVTIGVPVLLLIAWYVLSVQHWSRLSVLTLVALVFSWLGDSLGSSGLDLKLALFLVAQVCFAIAFVRPFRERWAGRPWWHHLRWLPYLGVVVGLTALVAPRAGVLAPAVVVYACGIGLMAVLASALGRLGLVGGVLFLISDGMLALQEFTTWWIPYQGLMIMATYLAAQAALAYAVASRS